MAERSLWGQLAWNLVGHRNTLRRPHEWLPWEVKSSQDAAASLTFLLRSSRSPDALDHHHEEHFATVPTSQPADPPTGNILDDLLLVLKRGQNETRCAVSIKSNRQLSKAGFNAEFVQDAWEQRQEGEGSDRRLYTLCNSGSESVGSK